MFSDPPTSDAHTSRNLQGATSCETDQAGAGPDSRTPFSRKTHLSAAAVVLAAGFILFGWQALRVVTICILTSGLIHWGFRFIRRQRISARGAIGLAVVVAFTLPPLVSWHVAVAATGVASLAVLLGGTSPLWNPVALGRIAVQILFYNQMTPALWPVLRRGSLLWGNLQNATVLSPLSRWSTAVAQDDASAWLVQRPVDLLRQTIALGGSTPVDGLSRLIRDALPDWQQTLWGTAGGAIGEASVLACIFAAIQFIRRGDLHLRSLVAAGLVMAAGASAIRVCLQTRGGLEVLSWPGLTISMGLPIGLVLIAYQLTAGEWPLIVALIAHDRSTCPAGVGGQVLFYVLIALLTICMRMYMGIPAAGYWALLIANMVVPLIRRVEDRRDVVLPASVVG